MIINSSNQSSVQKKAGNYRHTAELVTAGNEQ